MRHVAHIILFALTCSAIHGQDVAAQPAFEVASIRPSPPPDPAGITRVMASGGPGSKDPGLSTCQNYSLSGLILMAYDLKRYQLAAPDWLNAAKFDITARVPEGATRSAFRQMLQNLLAERFKLAAHTEVRELPVYELVIAKNGPTFKESVEVPATPDSAEAAPSLPPAFANPKLGKDGFPSCHPASRA